MMLTFFLVYSLYQAVGHLEYCGYNVQFAGLHKDISPVARCLSSHIS